MLKGIFCLCRSVSAFVFICISIVFAFGQGNNSSKDLKNSFKKYNLIRINSQAAFQKAETDGSLSISTVEKNFELNLTPRDLRSPNYRVEDTNANGAIRLEKSQVTTFRGKVAGESNSEVRLSIDGTKIEGYFDVNGEKFYVEPARNYSPSADAEEMVVYNEKDLLVTKDFVCHSEVAEKILRGREMVAANTVESAQALRVIKLATDADFEFVTQVGGAAQANSEILSILNMTEGVYEKELNLSLSVVFQHTWSTPDPFVPTTPTTLLVAFRDFWNTNFPQGQLPRDAAHLFSGKSNFFGLGLSYIGVVCANPNYAYGFSGRTTSVPANNLITTHEISHNLGARHVDASQNCGNTVMNAMLSDTTPLTFCANTRSEIGNFVSSSGGCLSERKTSAHLDFDGDNKADISVFRPSNGVWYITNSGNNSYNFVQFGAPGDKIVPGDYDGDGKTDLAVFRNGVWYRMKSSTNTFDALSLGVSTDTPVAADYDGDGKTDVSVFRASDGVWHHLMSNSNNAYSAAQFGANGDIPVAGDYDGDGKADVNVFRPSNGVWYRLNSNNGSFSAVQFGTNGDKPISGDFDGDGKADAAVFRPSTGSWYYINSTTGSFAGVSFGLPTDVPVAADYDGDGRTDVAVYRNGFWFCLNSSTNSLAATFFGADTDIPVPSHYLQ